MEEDAHANGLTFPAPADSSAVLVCGSAERSDATPTSAARDGSGASRLGVRWLGAIAAALAVVAAALATGGYLALRAHRESQDLLRSQDAAVAAAKDCVAATQPAEGGALLASQRKLSECSTRAFGAQIAWYSAVLAEAYQAVNVHVQVDDMRAAVERNNDDGSIVVLVAFRTTVSQVGMADRENSYRLRVKMVSEDGQFKVAELNQVTK